MTDCGMISIIIASTGRINDLTETLCLLSKLNPSVEIIVITDSITLTKLKRDFSWVHFYLETKHSASCARNQGALLARGSIFVFLDDDISWISKEWLTSLNSKFIDPSCGGVTGRVIENTDERFVKFKSSFLDAFSFPDRNSTGKILKDGTVIGRFNNNGSCYVDHLYGCNMAISKKAFFKAGGFDESFKINFREETDLSCRIRLNGYSLYYEDKALLVHKKAKTGGGIKSLVWRTRYYHVFKNHGILYFRYIFNEHKLYFVLFLLKNVLYAMLISFAYLNLTIIFSSINGILDAYRSYAHFSLLPTHCKYENLNE